MKFENKFISVIVSITFFALLAVLLFGTLFRKTEDYLYFENRTVTEMPDMKADAVLSGEYFTSYEKYLVDHAASRTTLVRLNTQIDLALCKPVVNNVVVCDDCLLPFNKFEGNPDLTDIESKAKAMSANISAHRDAAESYGGHFCYVAVPCQYVCLEDEYPWFLENRHAFTGASSAALFDCFDAAGIEYIDMYKDYRSLSDEEKERYVSKIDNHFSIFGGYETYLKMIEKINTDWNGNVPVLEEQDFEVKKIENHYLGSRGRMLFNLWNNNESLYYLDSKKQIPFRRFGNGVEESAQVYFIPENLYEFATYSVYMYGDNARTTIDTNRPELPSILIYGDSFTNAIECIAWQSFDKMESVDMRHYSEMTIDEVIESIKPDYVFCIRDYEQLIEANANGK